MPAYPFVTVDVFTTQRFGGNQLAVFPDARGLTDAQMQSLANEFNLSETTFVLPPDNPAHTARVRIFNRTYEMPFAGHPNVGTGYVLAQQGRAPNGVLLFEEIAGLVEIKIDTDATGTVVGATIAAPQPLSLGPRLPAETVAACGGIGTSDVIVTAHQPVQASVGNTFVLAEVSGDALSRATPDLSQFRRGLAAFPALNGRLSLYLYAHDGTRIRARMFAPLAGTYEDPATGSAATPLAALLLSLTPNTNVSYDIVQGVEMGRPSLLRTTAHRAEDGIRATVGGGCVQVLRGEATV
ncbi:PhzF family phenazine biosynthesis protein [Reyranella sp. CPCC 100927]|uniref:PhzF family phenazine biosynthesis protein n=1 Tax=Reyranella sp. CPCC 100927 TaxID=2599616 RepID=UPI0011B3EEEC|nr:PhzF family phenazine biosynthesis protein [Reyranella sp. CPCC 100927]TWT11733.1 PhzF family phenazine biosynthesis protein [Reyranella sp. CPCC 100927]